MDTAGGLEKKIVRTVSHLFEIMVFSYLPDSRLQHNEEICKTCMTRKKEFIYPVYHQQPTV